MEKKRGIPLVYVCSPYSGDVRGNAEKAKRYSRFTAERGAVPLAPHLLFPQFISEDTEREWAMRLGLAVLARCDAVYVFGSVLSNGMKAEIAAAERLGVEIHYFSEEDVGCES